MLYIGQLPISGIKNPLIDGTTAWILGRLSIWCENTETVNSHFVVMLSYIRTGKQRFFVIFKDATGCRNFENIDRPGQIVERERKTE